MTSSLTPSQIVERLNQYIVGQEGAKKSVAIALRNRYRRTKLEQVMRDEITPKNILMIGPTGVGKTEIARRLAKLVGAPFVKVEATKFTEVGYVGRDVESMVRDLIESSVRLVKEERVNHVKEQAKELAEKRLVNLLVPSLKKESNYKNPFEMLFNQTNNEDDQQEEQEEELNHANLKKKMAEKLERGELEDRMVTLEVSEQNQGFMDLFQGGAGMEQMGMNMQEMLGNMVPKKKKKRRMSVSDARGVLIEEEAQKLIDMMM